MKNKKTSEIKELIKKEFLKEYEHHDLSGMNVKNLCKQVPVARTTFYLYFDGLMDVRNEIEDDLLNGLVNIVRSTAFVNEVSSDLNDLLYRIKDYIQYHWNEFRVFVVDRKDPRFLMRWRSYIQESLKSRYPARFEFSQDRFILDVLSSSALQAYSEWFNNPENADPDRLIPLISQSVQSIVREM